MNNNFSENLKKIRKDNNLSQEQLAEELGVSRQAISKWESAVAYPEMDKIIALCDKFNLNIDDLLHKDIREIKGEEETKKNLNKYVDDFLNFITNTINMFSNMSFKSKIKCLFEQFVIGLILFTIFCIVGVIGQDLLSGIFGLIPEKIYFVVGSLIKLIYILFSFLASLMIMLHIFKTRYLDYYEKIKLDAIKEDDSDVKEDFTDDDSEKESSNKIDKKNKFLFKKNESKIIIRDPKHSEYKFITALSKFIVGIIKFFALCFSLFLFVILIGLVFCFVISFLTYKTGIFFIGLLVLFIALSVIDIDCILIILNFVFNRKNDKKKIIWSIIIALVFIGAGSGFVSIGLLDFDYIENDKAALKTDYIEFDMTNDLFFETYYNPYEVEYVESNISNVKVEYQINELCDIEYSYTTDSGIHIWGECSNAIKLTNEIVKNLNDKKIVSIYSDLESVKIYATKENIDILKNNRDLYLEKRINRDNEVSSYENRIDELEQQIDDYATKVWEYEQEISTLKDQLSEYQYAE